VFSAIDKPAENKFVSAVVKLLRTYDLELAKHLQKIDVSLVLFVCRWCLFLFVKDAVTEDVLRVWDSVIADARLEFCIFLSLAVLLSVRDQLLALDDADRATELLLSAPQRCGFQVLLQKAMAICAFERNETPRFPTRSALQVVDDISTWAHSTAMRASEVGSVLTRNLQEVTPVVLEHASKASAAAAVWLEETAPARRDAMDQAQTQFSTLWNVVRVTSAVAVEKGQILATGLHGELVGWQGQSKDSGETLDAQTTTLNAADIWESFEDP